MVSVLRLEAVIMVGAGNGGGSRGSARADNNQPKYQAIPVDTVVVAETAAAVAVVVAAAAAMVAATRQPWQR